MAKTKSKKKSKWPPWEAELRKPWAMKIKVGRERLRLRHGAHAAEIVRKGHDPINVPARDIEAMKSALSEALLPVLQDSEDGDHLVRVKITTGLSFPAACELLTWWPKDWITETTITPVINGEYCQQYLGGAPAPYPDTAHGWVPIRTVDWDLGSGGSPAASYGSVMHSTFRGAAAINDPDMGVVTEDDENYGSAVSDMDDLSNLQYWTNVNFAEPVLERLNGLRPLVMTLGGRGTDDPSGSDTVESVADHLSYFVGDDWYWPDDEGPDELKAEWYGAEEPLGTAALEYEDALRALAESQPGIPIALAAKQVHPLGQRFIDAYEQALDDFHSAI